MTIKTHTFKNDMKLVMIPQKGTKTTTVLVAVHAGSNYETKQQNGISHFLEHMIFKGTKKRPNTLSIAEALDSIGGDYNAFTGKEWTGYYAKAHVSHTSFLLDIISDIYLNSLFDAQEMEREKMVIVEEMNMYQDTPVRAIDDFIEEVLYPNQPQGRKIIGSEQTVKGITRPQLINYFKKRYCAHNTVVLIAGAISEFVTPPFVHSYFERVKKGVKEAAPYRVVEKQTRPQFQLVHKNTDQAHIDIALRGYREGHKDLPALHVLSIILGGNMSSRLFINVREREGLGYYIRSSTETHSQAGYLLIKCGVDTKRAVRALELIISELKNIQQNGITEKELEKAHDYFSGKLALSLETSDELAFWVGAQIMLEHRIKEPSWFVEKIKNVIEQDVARVSKEVIQNNRLNAVIIGPYSSKQKETLEKKCSLD